MTDRTLADVLHATETDQGPTLGALADARPLLIVLLRHAGCTFCKEALADLGQRRAAARRAGRDLPPLAVVHMSAPDVGRRLLDRYGLDDVPQVSDPGKRVYAAFELPRGTLVQLFGPRVWWRGLLATLRGHLVGRLDGDGFQMPGAFLVHRGRILRAHRHRDASDRPDYEGLCSAPDLADGRGGGASRSRREARPVAPAAPVAPAGAEHP